MRVRLSVALVSALVLASGCGGRDGTKVLKIGWFGDLSGSQAVSGNNELNAVKMLLDEINDAGGIAVAGHAYLFQLVGIDNRGDPQEAIEATRRLVNRDKVVAILGPDTSGNAIPIAPILEQAKVPDIATVATNPKVTVLDGRVKPYNFRVCFIDPYQGAVAAGFAFDVLRARRAAVLYEGSDEYSKGLRDYFIESFTRLGGTIVADESFASGTEDFGPQLAAIAKSRPQLVFMPYFFKEVALSARQARELGISVPLMGGDGWPSDQLIPLGGPALEGCFFVNHLDYNDPAVGDFRDRYRSRYGVETELNGYLANDAVLLLVDALKRATEPTGEALARALAESDIQGITGRIKISPATHNPEGKDAAIVRIANGAYVFMQKYAAQQGTR